MTRGPQRRGFRFSLAQMVLAVTMLGLVLAFARAVIRNAGESFHPQCLAYSPDGKNLAAGFSDGKIKIWDLASGREQSFSALGSHDYVEIGGSVLDLSFDADGQTLVTVSSGGAVNRWNTDRRGRKTGFRTPVDPQLARLSSDGQVVATCDRESVALYDTKAGKQLQKWTADAEPKAIVFSSDGTTLAVGYENEQVDLHDVQTGKRLFRVNTQSEPCALALSPNRRTLAAADGFGGGGDIALWDIGTGRRLARFGGLSEDVTELLFSRDDRSLIACDNDGTIVVWDVRTQKKLRTLTRRLRIMPLPTASSSAAVAFAPQGDVLATSSVGQVALWDMKTLRKRSTVWSNWRPYEYLFGVGFIVWAVAWGLAGGRRAVKPPAALIVCWVMMGSGGALAIMFSMALVFDIGGCCLFLPTVYYGVVMGIVALTRGVGRSRTGLATVSVMQMCNIMNCDFFNLAFGIVGQVLLRGGDVRRYLES
ncbi:MAG: PQQ-binding-like beta-propeller repeat protein [Pirellulaceae bacterium]|nr:PQQ-binding-like beta-propeller repeat protein [Pirellulaceae bacterium]